jgi:xanthine/uracil permease
MTNLQPTNEARYTARRLGNWCTGASDRLDGVILAALFVWGGIAFFASVSGLVARIPVPDVTGWTVFLLGAGVIVAIEILIRLMSTDHKRSQLMDYIAAAFFFGVGLGLWWVVVGLVLLIIGVGIARDVLAGRAGAGDGRGS